jgi:S-adenosyl-L-methionine hydrolase (adenosine-forming)
MRITLLTDFGTMDGYVAAMKGVAATVAPGVIIDDLSHDIPPGDVRAAAWALTMYWDRYPPGTVHVVVVDPGVGSARRPLALACGGRFLVGPDNGVFTAVLNGRHECRAVAIENPAVMCDVVSSTFHGRDIFMPAAAHLAAGMGLESLGPVVADPVLLDLPVPAQEAGVINGAVVHVDRFGNLVTNIPAAMAAAGGAVVHIRSRRLPLLRTYADAGSGGLLALVGSHGYVEVAVRDGNAAETLQSRRGEAVRLVFLEEGLAAISGGAVA